ncbi:MAG: GntR family transcriptional regulator, partial [Halanaerobiaceae bacterium]
DLVETKRGRGTFVKEDDGMITDIKAEMAKGAAHKFLQEMKSLGFEINEILKLIEKEARIIKE